MRRIFFLAFLALLCLGVGLALSYGGEDSSPKPATQPSSDTWKDPTSRLTWQVSPTGGKMNSSAAKAHCKSLSLAGHRDWRLPTISELRSLIRGCPATQKGGSCGVADSCSNDSCWKDTCSGCSSKGGPGPGGAYWPTELSGDVVWYWSSSTVEDDGSVAWGVDFNVGGVVGNVGGGVNARCVR